MIVYTTFCFVIVRGRLLSIPSHKIIIVCSYHVVRICLPSFAFRTFFVIPTIFSYKPPLHGDFSQLNMKWTPLGVNLRCNWLKLTSFHIFSTCEWALIKSFALSQKIVAIHPLLLIVRSMADMISSVDLFKTISICLNRELKHVKSAPNRFTVICSTSLHEIGPKRSNPQKLKTSDCWILLMGRGVTIYLAFTGFLILQIRHLWLFSTVLIVDLPPTIQ